MNIPLIIKTIVINSLKIFQECFSANAWYIQILIISYNFFLNAGQIN